MPVLNASQAVSPEWISQKITVTSEFLSTVVESHNCGDCLIVMRNWNSERCPADLPSLIRHYRYLERLRGPERR